MTQTATAPDGYGLTIWTGGDNPEAYLREDGMLVNGGEAFPTAAAARNAAWKRYQARHDGQVPKFHPPGYCAFSWETSP